jgi:hypothetical protein
MEKTTTGLIAHSVSHEQAMFSLIGEHEHSGVSIKQFCKSKQLSEASYYYWKKKLRQRMQREAEGPAGFTMLDVNGGTAGNLFCEVIAPSGSLIRFYQPVSGPFLQSLL